MARATSSRFFFQAALMTCCRCSAMIIFDLGKTVFLVLLQRSSLQRLDSRRSHSLMHVFGRNGKDRLCCLARSLSNFGCYIATATGYNILASNSAITSQIQLEPCATLLESLQERLRSPQAQTFVAAEQWQQEQQRYQVDLDLIQLAVGSLFNNGRATLEVEQLPSLKALAANGQNTFTELVLCQRETL